jgi:hypothetical protein
MQLRVQSFQAHPVPPKIAPSTYTCVHPKIRIQLIGNQVDQYPPKPVCLRAGGKGNEVVDTAPQVLLACVALWRVLLSLHKATASPLQPPVLSSSQLAECVREMAPWMLVAKGCEDEQELPSGTFGRDSPACLRVAVA